MRGNTIVEQVDHDGNTYMDVDISLSAKDLLEVLKTYFPDIRKDKGMITGNFKDRPYSCLLYTSFLPVKIIPCGNR